MQSLELQVRPDIDEVGIEGARIAMNELSTGVAPLVCTASGQSPVPIYRRLSGMLSKEARIAKRMRVIKLDEWIGVPLDKPGSCEYAIRSEFVEPAGIPASAFVGFHSDPSTQDQEVERIEKFLGAHEPIDLAILGLGRNGHIGFNEPGDFLIAESHTVSLTEESQSHPMTVHQARPPVEGITLGMRAILNARTILLVVTGEHKQSQLKRLLQGPVSTSFPASFLHLHRRVICLADQAAIAPDTYSDRKEI